MKQIRLLLCFVFCISFFNCGSDAFQDGKKAFAQGEYNDAIKFFEKVSENESRTNEYFEMLSLAYMYRGKQLYEKTKNAESYKANYHQSQKVLPPDLSKQFKQKYSKLLFELAKGYSAIKSENNIKRQKNFDFINHLLNNAFEYDSTNTEYVDLLKEVEKNYFEELLAQAEMLYNKAVKRKDMSLYISSRGYLEKAASFNDENAEILSLQKKIRKKLLPVFDKTEGLALAVTDYIKEKSYIKMMLAIENYSQEPVWINPDSFRLVDKRGNTYQLDIKEMELYEVLGRKFLKKTKLTKSNPYTDGIIIFSVSKNVQVDYISYVLNNEEITRKYF